MRRPGDGGGDSRAGGRAHIVVASHGCGILSSRENSSVKSIDLNRRVGGAERAMRTKGEKRKRIVARKQAPVRWVTRGAPPADGSVDVIVKFGGAAITVKDGEPDTLNDEALGACCASIAEVVRTEISELAIEFAKESPLRVIVVHGAGSFGHPQAKQYGVADGGDMDGDPVLREGVDKTKASVRKLCRLVCDELTSHTAGSRAWVKPAPISPYGKFFTVGKKLNRNLSRGGFDEVRAALMEGKIPVLHGDVVNDAEQGCAILSGDTLVECLTEEFKPKRVVFVSDVEGIFTAKPLHKNGPCDLCPDGKTPPPALLREIQVNPDGSWIATRAFGPCGYLYLVEKSEWQREWQQANPLWKFSDATDERVVESAVGTTDATVSLADNGDVTGGIKTKVQEAAAIALKGVDVFLTNHQDEDIVSVLYGHHENDSRFEPHWFGTHVKMLAPEVENEPPA